MLYGGLQNNQQRIKKVKKMLTRRTRKECSEGSCSKVRKEQDLAEEGSEDKGKTRSSRPCVSTLEVQSQTKLAQRVLTYISRMSRIC